MEVESVVGGLILFIMMVWVMRAIWLNRKLATDKKKAAYLERLYRANTFGEAMAILDEGWNRDAVWRVVELSDTLGECFVAYNQFRFIYVPGLPGMAADLQVKWAELARQKVFELTSLATAVQLFDFAYDDLEFLWAFTDHCFKLGFEPVPGSVAVPHDVSWFD